jgi:hypothetical protein
MVHGFNKKDAERIGKSVKFTERQTQDQAILSRRHKKRSTGGGGTTILWAKVTAVTDANNYTVSTYDRSDESTALATAQACYVYDVVDEMLVDDWFPVQTSNKTDIDYECIQQIGAVG